VKELPVYAAGSDGPAEADDLIIGNGHHWRKLKDSNAGCD
jgi:glucose-6-phosphate 1-dehydrogenase